MNEENKSANVCNCEGGCGMCHGSDKSGMKGMCGCCGGWSWHRMGHHALLRIILALAILAIVFKVGVEFGEFKGEFMSGHGYGDERVMIYRRGMDNMMGGAAILSNPNQTFQVQVPPPTAQ